MLKTIELSFEENNLINIFSKKSNKTLQEIILTTKYLNLKEETQHKYKNYLDLSIGTFLYELKQSNDLFYKNFLNPFGDLIYSNFSIKNKNDYDLKGVYFYYLNDEIKYIGRCKDNMRKRVNSGYGKISPQNCFKDGQSTNCKVNSFVTKYKDNIELRILVLEDDKEIERLEKELIYEHKPMWNGGKNGK